MLAQVLLYVGSAFLLFWGIAHLIPTRNVVRGFGEISPDNKRIITMEWIVEGACLIFMAAIVSMLTFIDYTNGISKLVYWISFLMLNILSIISLFTGFKVKFLPFKLCPAIFATASILILVGSFI